MRSLLFFSLLACAQAAEKGAEPEYMHELATMCASSPCYIGMKDGAATVTMGTPIDMLAEKPLHGCGVHEQNLPYDLDAVSAPLHGLQEGNPLLVHGDALDCGIVVPRQFTDATFGPYCTVQYLPIDSPRGVPRVVLTSRVSGTTRTLGFLEGRLVVAQQ